ncbi:uncharacterized protein PGTG_20818 [Puccinia graminis f. sp. tritici CRL 75-36-700-3]|uniref:Uncharacterized protein n=1 Tax=Puccinia graminis f. sp. tritici (strain CRL 75-36-700-3 / race SCCL) TaxID=418459 RepID=H6QPS2_PUCGT|nr:uncharacterized protein PGTG_20818 [Puccinia graminis f. sp. tritici CRL 75-36-700-3]EHS64119.1 hypothetical protein PGTG_20818 [Puccinia graminis f. sp. tritici CRL 75-36-700-3]
MFIPYNHISNTLNLSSGTSFGNLYCYPLIVTSDSSIPNSTIGLSCGFPWIFAAGSLIYGYNTTDSYLHK